MNDYSFEIWNRTGSLIADLTGIATDRTFEAERNAAGQINFNIDAKLLNDYATANSTSGAAILSPGANEVRVKRGATYLMGGKISYFETTGSGAEKEVSVKADGFLNLFKDRFYEKQRVFTGVQASTILWTVIDETQTASSNFYDSSMAALPSSTDTTFGVTQGTLDTIGTKDRTYDIGKNVKDILVQMTELQTTATDIYFTYDKIFNAVVRQGSDKPGIVFETGKNIISYRFPVDAQSLANRVLTTGSGSEGGGTLVTSVVQDTSSQTNYRVRQLMRQFNSISEQDTLDDHGNAYLAAAKDPLNVPEITVDLNGDIDIEDLWVGDRVTVNVFDPELPSDPSGFYRVEKINMSISNEGNETAQLSLSV